MSDEPPDLSIVMPCYNEAAVLPLSIPPLVDALEREKISYELVLVDNGSKDDTASVIDGLRGVIRRVDVAVNQGFGWGVIEGLRVAKGRFVGYMGADGQILPEDVIRGFRQIEARPEGGVISKVRRITRNDGWIRWTTSRGYNLLFLVMFRIGTTDVNGTPKFMTREDLARLVPSSRDWFLDAEVMIKVRELGFAVVEVPVDFHQRSGGKSSVRISTVFEFLRNMLRYRFGGPIAAWKASREGIDHGRADR